MQTLAERGDTVAALGVYEQLRRLVRDELGVDPGPDAARAAPATAPSHQRPVMSNQDDVR
jgi:DNA-binding SARP family transcriptional activator